jgi:hypothetical protein
MFSSCDKKLTEIEPEYFINTRGDIKTLEDCNKLLNGAYKAMINISYYGGNMLLTDLMSGDAIKGNTTYLDGMELVDWAYSPISPITAKTWMAAYNVIAHTNIVIESVNKVPNTNDQLRRKILGQAYAIRGLVFFDILRLYGEDYDRNSDKLGIVARTNVDITSIKRSSVKDSYTQIFSDLVKAEDELKGLSVNAGNNNFIDEWGAKALLARVYLYAGMYKEAYDHASMVIENSKFKLESPANFLKVWRDDVYGGEIIFGLRVNLVDNIRVGTFMTDYDGAYKGIAKRNYFDPSVILTNNYDKKMDIRYNAYFNDTIRVGTPTSAKTNRALLTKYSGRNESWNNIQDIKLIRLAEMFLIRAEAAYYDAGLGETVALNDLHAVQSARISGHVPLELTGDELKKAIQLERRKEFSFEAQIWFDLRRYKMKIERDPNIFKSNKATNLTLQADSYLRAWPIPFAEVANTEGVPVKQNDQY